MESPDQKAKRRRRRGWWIFIFVNVIGIVIALPLLNAVFPLMRIWWNTRSQESVKQQMKTSPSRSESQPAIVFANNVRTADPHPDLTELTNKLKKVEHVTEDEIKQIVAEHFGPKKPVESDPAKFDNNSAVFHEIRRFTTTLEGKEYYCYEIDLEDQHGNHKKHVDCFEEPDLDYERSMATLELVRGNPQLKRIYDAFSHVLAEKSQGDGEQNDTPPPAMRLEPAEAPK